jgi:hypothetical protein
VRKEIEAGHDVLCKRHVASSRKLRGARATSNRATSSKEKRDRQMHRLTRPAAGSILRADHSPHTTRAMAKRETKEAAEAVLRELPSVVGAFVQEDSYGHPREVHLLVKHGPDPRHLARDIRDLLEERLGLPIDQRVISIAQLAPADESAGSTADTHHEAGRADTAAGVATPSAPGNAKSEPTAHDQGKPAAVASEPQPSSSQGVPEPRLRFIGVETQVRDARVLVRAELQAGPRQLQGEAVELEAANGRARAGAAAALQAVTHAADKHGRFELENASVVRVHERDYVLVSALASSPYLGRRPVSLCGAQLVDVDVESAAALGALKAVNRILALMLRMGEHG